MSEPKPIKVNLKDVPPATSEHGPSFGSTRRALGAATRAHMLGASHMVVPPGRRAWPYHWHAGNEEAIFVLSGKGELRVGQSRIPIEPGDFVALPTGPDHAHALTNTGDADLEYLCVSTMVQPDVVGYPDSGKVGVFAGSAPGGPRAARTLSGFHRQRDGVGYWDGEPGADDA